MVPIVWIGALLVVAGVLLLARSAIHRGKMSSSRSGTTLEPDRPTLRFLGLTTNWPGFLLVFIGALILLWGSLAGPFSQG